jgi:chromosome segregation ATPase
MPILEDVVALLQTKPNPADLPKSMELFTGGIVDLTQRLRNLEYQYLAVEHRLSLMETAVAESKTAVTAMVNERSAYNSRVEAIEKAPLDISKKLEAIETRLRTVEGAVGSTAFAAAKNPSAAIKPVDPAAPVKPQVP